MRCRIAAFFLVLGCFDAVYAGDDIQGSANVSYYSSERKTSQEDKRSWSMYQTYNLGLNKEFTPKVNLAANVGVNVNETDNTKGTRLYPDLRLNTSNEYFDANWGYQLTERGLDVLTMVSDEDRLTTKSWNANVASKSERYPRMQMRYNEDKSYDHLTVHETNTQNNTFTGNANYSFHFLNFYYQYGNKTSDDYVKDSSQETDTHEGRVDFAKSFWDNKATSSGSYSLKEDTVETIAGGQEIEVISMESASDGLHKSDPANPLNVALDTGIAALKNGDKASTAGIEIGLAGSTDENIGLDFGLDVEINRIYLYTTTPHPTLFAENDYTWAVYHSSDNNTWTLITAAASHDYDTIQQRFEITFTATSARYFKVINTTNDGNALEITEMEAYGSTIQASNTTREIVNTTETIHTNVGVKPFSWLSLMYNVKQDMQKEHEITADSTKRRRSSHNATGIVEKGFQVHEYLMIRPGYQTQWEYQEDSRSEVRDSTDTFRLHFLSSPLETLGADLSLNHALAKKDNELLSNNSSALFHVAANLREGADLDVDANASRNENLSSDTVTMLRSVDSNLHLELTSTLTTDLEYSINWSDMEITAPDPEEGASTRNSLAKATLYWRPSHDLYLKGSYGIDRDEESGDQTFSYSYNLNWLLTDKLQLGMDFAQQRNGAVTTRYSSDLAWNLSRTFSFKLGYDWTLEEALTETEIQTVTSDLSAQF